MRLLWGVGIWELFIPGLEAGHAFKYEILGGDGFLRSKTNPDGMCFEVSSHNSTIVYDLEGYDWGDETWMYRRKSLDW